MKIGTSEFSSHLKSLKSQIFGGLYQNVWKNLKYLPPDIYENQLDININSDILKKRLLNIQIVITDTIKSHSFIHVNDELKKEIIELKKENERLKKLIEIVHVRGALESAVFQIKSNYMNDEELKKKIKFKWDYKTATSNVLRDISENGEITDMFWTNSSVEDKLIENRRKAEIKKCLPELFGQLSEVIHDPTKALELNLKYPMIIKCTHVGDSPKRLLALKEIIEKTNSHIDNSGNVMLKFE